MGAHVVAQVGEVGSARVDVLYQGEGLVEVDVGHVGFVSQSVDDEGVYAAHGVYGLLWQCLAVGDVSEAVGVVGCVYAESEYGQSCVHDGDGQYAYSVDMKFFVWFDDVYVVGGYAGV